MTLSTWRVHDIESGKDVTLPPTYKRLKLGAHYNVMELKEVMCVACHGSGCEHCTRGKAMCSFPTGMGVVVVNQAPAMLKRGPGWTATVRRDHLLTDKELAVLRRSEREYQATKTENPSVNRATYESQIEAESVAFHEEVGDGDVPF